MYKIFCFKILKMIIFLLLIISAKLHELQADDSILSDNGKTVFPMITNEVEMISEDVVIKIKDKKTNAVFPLREAYVNCVFWFSNMTEKPIKAKVGFPGNEQDNFATYSRPLSSFTVKINDKYLTVEIEKEFLKDYGFKHESYRNWYTWEMTFSSNSITKIENSYFTLLGSPSGYDPFFLKYELSTGSNWKDRISTATLRVIYKNEKELTERIIDLKPKGWIRNKNEIIWNFKNIEPTEMDNIFIFEKNIGLHPNYSDEATIHNYNTFFNGNRKTMLFKK